AGEHAQGSGVGSKLVVCVSKTGISITVDDDADPSFGDADYQLAAYAAALRVLTSYSEIDEIDITRELRRPRKRGESSPITSLIEQAVDIATNAMVPRGIQP